MIDNRDIVKILENKELLGNLSVNTENWTAIPDWLLKAIISRLKNV